MNNNKTYFFIQFTIYQFLETIFFLLFIKGKKGKYIIRSEKRKQMNVWESFKREENENCHKIICK